MRLPGWDSLAFVEHAHSVLELAGIICLALLVVAEVLRWQYGSRAKALTEQAQPPHVLTEEQRATISEKTKRLAGAELEIASIVGDVEAKALADEIAGVLRSVGWKVQQSTPFFREPTANKLLIMVRDPGDDPPPAANALYAALQAAGLAVSGAHSNQVRPGGVQLMIGERTPTR